MKKVFGLLLLTAILTSCAVKKYPDLKEEGIYAEIITSKGTMLAKLYEDKVPMTVANFVALADGNHPKVADSLKKKPFYNGLTFHRVIENFMIQGGDITGTGGGNVGFKFPQEVREDLKHDDKGILSMANAGPNTNGSQFFIMHKANPSLDMRYNVFGKVIRNVAVVDSIATVDKNGEKPKETVYMNEINIIRVGKTAKKWKADKVFLEAIAASEKEESERVAKVAALKANAPKARKDKAAELKMLETKALALPSGIKIYSKNLSTGAKPNNGDMVDVNYSGFLTDGTLFDSSYKEVSMKFDKYDERRDTSGNYKPLKIKYDPNMGMIAGFKEALLTMSYGDELVVFIPPSLGYGNRGSGGAIPANADLIFEIKMEPKN